MPAIRTILHPTDFSQNSEYACGLACSLAEKFNARLILFHVVPAPGSQAPTRSPPAPAEAQTPLSGRFAWPKAPRQITVEHRIAQGHAPEEILRLARDASCDLIVLGTQGRTGLQRVIVGSVAEGVLRKAVCPVLTVKAPRAGSSPAKGIPDFHRILHPTDFSPGSDYAFEFACRLAEEFAAELLLLHVVPASSAAFVDEPPFDPLKSAESQEYPQGHFAWPQPRNPSMAVDHRLGEGEPSEEILRLTQKDNCDLIVMGTQGRTGLERVLLGSVAEAVLRTGACPVLTVKPPAGWVSSVRYSPSFPRPCEVRDVRPLGAMALISAPPRRTLLKTGEMEVVRLVVPKGQKVSEDSATGETLFQCLEGKVAFTAYGQTQALAAGNLLYLPRGEAFTVEGMEDASVLVTVLSPKR